MSTFESIYLFGSIGAFALFAVVVAYVSHVTTTVQREAGQHAPAE